MEESDERKELQRYKKIYMLSCIPFLFFLPLVINCGALKKFYANQGLVLLVLFAAAGIIHSILHIALRKFWLADWFVTGAFGLLYVALTVFAVAAAVSVANEEKRSLPLFGKIVLLK